MQGDDSRRESIRRYVRYTAVAMAIGQAVFGAALLYGLHAPEPTILKIGAYGLIGWAPVAALMSYSEMNDQWGDGRELWASVSMGLIMLTLGFLAWYLS
jgi:preprotein translocase subunit SecY